MASLKVAVDAYLEEFITPFAETIGFVKLPEWFPTIIYSALGYTFLHLVASPYLSKKFTPQIYAGFKTRKARNNWNIHLVSLVNALLLNYLAFRGLYHEGTEKDKAFGWDDSVGLANAVAVGHFMWDAADASINFIDIGFLIHGFACMILYSLTFRPFVAYYAPRFLLWELSTPFLNVHWILDKLNMTGSNLQFINGIVLLATFFCARIAYGWYLSYHFWGTLIETWGQVPLPIVGFLALGNVTLNTLNLIWFSRMIRTIRKRFQKDVNDPRKKKQ